MGLNIAHTASFHFENRENLRNTARDILSRQGASEEFTQKFIDDAIFSQMKNKVDYLRVHNVKIHRQLLDLVI